MSMYCLGFGGNRRITGEETKAEKMSASGHYTNMDALGPDYVPPYQRPEAFGTSQLFPDVDMDGAVMSKQPQSKPAPFVPSVPQPELYVPLHERESRFQQELTKVHHDRSHRSEHHGPQYRTDVVDDARRHDVGGFGARDGQEMDVDMTFVHDSRPKKNKRYTEDRQETQQLRKELRRTRRILECEKSQKAALKDRMGNLEHQIDSLRRGLLPRSGFEPQGTSHHHLEDQLRQLQHKYECERELRHKVQAEYEAVKKENKRHKEQIRHLLFQQSSGVTTKFQDIGPVDHSIVESSEGVGSYDFGGNLGEGHYGKVTVGRNKNTNQKYAIKVLAKERITRFKDLQQVAIEVHVLRKYPHPNIVHLEQVIHAPNNIYLVTELCAMDLHKYHNEIGLSEFGAKQVILGILKPLHHLHSHGICHLDLKPENILLSASVDTKNVTQYDIRLCDFGLVNMARNPAQSTEIVRKGYACGTPGFFAPEMILNNEFEGKQADMWSLGSIVLEITLGFTQEWIDSYEVMESHPTQSVDGLRHCLSEIAPEHYPTYSKLLSLIHACLSLNPKQRIDAGQAMVHPWLEEVVSSDEGRQEAGHSGRSVPMSPSPRATALYAERSALVPCIMPC